MHLSSVKKLLVRVEYGILELKIKDKFQVPEA